MVDSTGATLSSETVKHLQAYMGIDQDLTINTLSVS